MVTIFCGKVSPRGPIYRHPDELVDVLDGNERRRKRARDLVLGDVLHGVGVVASLVPAAEAA